MLVVSYWEASGSVALSVWRLTHTRVCKLKLEADVKIPPTSVDLCPFSLLLNSVSTCFGSGQQHDPHSRVDWSCRPALTEVYSKLIHLQLSIRGKFRQTGKEHGAEDTNKPTFQRHLWPEARLLITVIVHTPTSQAKNSVVWLKYTFFSFELSSSNCQVVCGSCCYMSHLSLTKVSADDKLTFRRHRLWPDAGFLIAVIVHIPTSLVWALCGYLRSILESLVSQMIQVPHGCSFERCLWLSPYLQLLLLHGIPLWQKFPQMSSSSNMLSHLLSYE